MSKSLHEKLAALKLTGAFFAPVNFYQALDSLDIKTYLLQILATISENTSDTDLKAKCDVALRADTAEDLADQMTPIITRLNFSQQFYGTPIDGLHPDIKNNLSRLTQKAKTFYALASQIAPHAKPFAELLEADLEKHAHVYIHFLNSVAPNNAEALLDNALACSKHHLRELIDTVGRDLYKQAYPIAAQIVLLKFWHAQSPRQIRDFAISDVFSASEVFWGNKNTVLLNALRHPSFELFVLNFILEVKAKSEENEDEEENLDLLEKLALTLNIEKDKDVSALAALGLPKSLAVNFSWLIQQIIYYKTAKLFFDIERTLPGQPLDDNFRKIGMIIGVGIGVAAEIYLIQNYLPSFFMQQLLNEMVLKNPTCILEICSAFDIDQETYFSYLPLVELTLDYFAFLGPQYWYAWYNQAEISGTLLSANFAIFKAMSALLNFGLSKSPLKDQPLAAVGVHYLSAWSSPYVLQSGTSLAQWALATKSSVSTHENYLQTSLCLTDPDGCKKAASGYLRETLQLSADENLSTVCKNKDVLRKGLNQDPLILSACNTLRQRKK